MWSALVAYTLLSTLTFMQCANILAIFPLAGRSHFVMFERLMKGLAEKGHNVDVASHFPQKKPFPRYNDLNLKGSLPIFVNNLTVSTFENFSNYKMLDFITTVTGAYTCEATFNTPALRNLRNSTKKYDLVFTEIFGSDCMLGFGHWFKAPVISLISSVAHPWAGDRIGNPDNPSYIKTYFLQRSGQMSLYDRMWNTLISIQAKLHYAYSGFASNKVARAFFGDDLPSLETLALNTSLVLVNSHFSMNEPRPVVPNFVEVGGLHVGEPQPLNDHFKELLKFDPSTQKGVIFLTMGSMILTESFPVERLQGMFDAFAQLPYKVLWKAVEENMPAGLRIPPNIHFELWMPQLDILCHPNVKLFVSHGGLMGSQEAVYCGVPRVGIPLFADQETNIRQAEEMGIAIRVGYDEISKEKIFNAAKSLTEDPKYQQNAQRIAKIFKDRPSSPLDTAIYWTEYVIRHRGAPHLRTLGADLPWYQYHLVDVGFILLAIVSTVLFLIVFALHRVLNLFGSNSRRKLGKTKRKMN